MTDTQPEIPGAEDALKPVDPPFEGSTEKVDAPAPKPRKRAAKKAAAPTPEPATAPRDAAYLPTLPEGYSYTKVEIDGPDGNRLVIGCSVEGNFAVDVEADDINRSTPYPSFALALRGAADRAKLLVKRAARRAELDALDAEFGE